MVTIMWPGDRGSIGNDVLWDSKPLSSLINEFLEVISQMHEMEKIYYNFLLSLSKERQEYIHNVIRKSSNGIIKIVHKDEMNHSISAYSAQGVNLDAINYDEISGVSPLNEDYCYFLDKMGLPWASKYDHNTKQLVAHHK